MDTAMFGQHTIHEKMIIGSLVKAGNELSFTGEGWVINGEVFPIFRDFISFCSIKAEAIKLVNEMHDFF